MAITLLLLLVKEAKLVYVGEKLEIKELITASNT